MCACAAVFIAASSAVISARQLPGNDGYNPFAAARPSACSRRNPSRHHLGHLQPSPGNCMGSIASCAQIPLVRALLRRHGERTAGSDTAPAPTARKKPAPCHPGQTWANEDKSSETRASSHLCFLFLQTCDAFERHLSRFDGSWISNLGSRDKPQLCATIGVARGPGYCTWEVCQWG